MAPTLYLIYASPPVRAVLVTAKALGLELNHKEMDFRNGELMKPEYLKLNPQHTVPTLVDDDGFTIWDSHAIMGYLVSKYAKDDSLYPQDPRKRAIVNQRLHFDSGVAFASLIRITRPFWIEGRRTIFQEDKDNMIGAYEFLEKFLEGKKWVAGDCVTIADYSLGTTIGSIGTLITIDPQKFPNITKWLKNFEALPEFEANRRGLNEFTTIVTEAFGKQD